MSLARRSILREILTFHSVLLFVFWYCHKRGKEVRLSKEGKEVEVDSDLETSEVLEKPAESTESPIKIGTDPSTEEKPSVVLEDILNKPAPAEVPLPAPQHERELATPVGASK